MPARLRTGQSSRENLFETAVDVAPVAVVLAGALAMAQSQKSQPKGRTVKGTVVDKKGNPIRSALISLKKTYRCGPPG